MASLLELSGGSPPQKQPHYAAIFQDRSFTGLCTNRAPLHDPASILETKYYGGRPDALWAGLNIELTNRLTLQPRPGLVPFNNSNPASPGFTYPTAPLTAYTFHLIDGTLRVMIDTGTTGPSEQDSVTAVSAPVGVLATYTGTFTSGAANGLEGFNVTIAGMGNAANNGVFPVYFSTATTITVVNSSAVAQSGQTATATTLYVTSVAASTASATGLVTAIYTGVFTKGASNAFAGYQFTIAGFTQGSNNGTFLCTASSGTTLTLLNTNAKIETANATAISSGAVYWDEQNGSAVLIWGKGKGAGQTYFIASGGILFFADGVDTKKWTPHNLNFPPGPPGTQSVWNWGIVAPELQPTIQIVASGSAAQQWQASTVFSTMGITYDATNNQVWQLIGVNASPVQNPNTTNATSGTSGAGGPNWNNTVVGTETAFGTTLETSGTPITWKNIAWLQLWAEHAIYGDAGQSGTGAANCAVFVPANGSIPGAIYLNFNGSGNFSRSGSIPPPFSPVVGWQFTEQSDAGGTVAGVPYAKPHWFFFCTFAEAQAWSKSTAIPAWYGADGGTDSIAASVVEPYIFPIPTVGVGINPNTGQPNPPTPVFLQINNGAAGTTGTTYIPFPATPVSIGQQVIDNQLLWQCISSPAGASNALTAAWTANFAYVPWTISGGTFGCIYDPGTSTLQVCTNSTGGGLSGAHAPGTTLATAASIVVAANSPSAGLATYTDAGGYATLVPAAGDYVKFTGFTNAGNNGTFQVVTATSTVITVSNLSAVNETHNANAVWNPWGTTYAATTHDGSLTWSCVGQPYGWTSNTLWNLPLTGFAPPQQSQQYGGSTIDAAGDVQTTIQSGKSGLVAPSWNGLHMDTTDGSSSPQLVWYAESVQNANSLAFQKGYSYAYSYKARPLDDIYSAPPLGGINGVQQIPPGDTAYLTTPPPGSQTNAVSSASPANTFTGSNAGAVIYVSGVYSTDPQVDTIIIWRSDDGGGPDQMYELTEINNLPGGGPWTFQDYLPDAPTGTIGGLQFPGLNTSIPAPINGVNDPPDSTFLPQVYNFERVWGADGQYVAFSGGPDTFVGNPDEAFSVSDSLPFLAPVTRVAKCAQGLVTFLTDSIQVIVGGPATSTFSQLEWAAGIGLLDYNMFDQLAGEMYFFSSDSSFIVMTPSLNITNAGFAIADQFANLPTSGTPSSGITTQVWAPTTGYVASHRATLDNAIFVADGRYGWYRLNQRQSGAGFLNPTADVWSPFGAVTNGCKMVMSIETTPGVKQLLVGPTIGFNQILARSLTTFTDNGTAYDAYFDMGNITIAYPGQIGLLKFITLDFSGVGFKPTISYLLNEVAGTFEPFTANPIFDPPQIYGATISPTSYSPNRYYFASNAFLARCRHMRVKVDWVTSTNSNELYDMTIYGRLMVEN